MILSLIIFGAVYILIAFEIVDKTAAALAGAIVVLALHLVPFEEAAASIDMNVLFLLIGMMIVMSVLSDTGVLEWLAVSIAQKARGNAKLIIPSFLLVTAAVSAFLDNVTTVILIAPITILITQLIEIPAAPVLILLAIFSNIGGTATLIGDPPNILIGSQTGLGFNDFIVHLTPVIAIITGVCLFFESLRLRTAWQSSEDARRRVMIANPRLAILDYQLLRRSLGVLALILAGFFTSRLTGIEPGIVALGGAVVMIIVCRADIHQALGRVEWSVILFFIGLFMLISSLEFNGVFTAVGQFLVKATGGNLLLTGIVILWASAFISAVVDNIPLVIAMIPLIESMAPSFAEQHAIAGGPGAPSGAEVAPLYWCLALGACLGGNGTLIGASANVVMSQIGGRNNCKITFWDFTKAGFPLMLVTVAMSTVYVYLRYFR